MNQRQKKTNNPKRSGWYKWRRVLESGDYGDKDDEEDR